MSRKRVARLMRQQGLAGRRRRRFQRTTDSNHRFPVAANILMRDFRVKAPNLVWATDITYIWTQEGWLYLAVILDLFSRRVVGFAIKEQVTRELALEALGHALGRRHETRDLIHHSDRGSQYASHDYRRALERAGITCSMSRRGNCWDNAVVESFFGTLKTELIHEREFATRAAAKSAIAEYSRVGPVAYGIDFGVLTDGRTVLVEVNEGYSLNPYGLESMEYAELLEARWLQLMGV